MGRAPAGDGDENSPGLRFAPAQRARGRASCHARGGYALEPCPDDLDADRFERLAPEGRAALDRGDPDSASARLAEALALWRGPPLADLAYESFAQDAIARLEEARLVAIEDRIEADLALGRHGRWSPSSSGWSRTIRPASGCGRS